jgi:anti-sigma regulatory factor (Ser/Thr protein kinase)
VTAAERNEPVIKEEPYNDGVLEGAIFFEGHLCVMVLAGRMETDSANELGFRLREKGYLGTFTEYDFIVDIEKVNFIASSGLKFLVSLSGVKRNFFKMSRSPNRLNRIMESHGLYALSEGFDSLGRMLGSAGASQELIQKAMARKEGMNPPRFSSREYNILTGSVGDKRNVSDVLKDMYTRVPGFNVTGEEIIVPAEKIYAAFVYKYLLYILNARCGLLDKNIYGPAALDEEMVEFTSVELVNNAITHGYGGKTNNIIVVRHRIDPGSRKLYIYFVDLGKGYNRLAADLDAFTLKSHTGISILRQYFDKVTLTSPAPDLEIKHKDYRPGRGTLVTLIKELNIIH